MKCWIARVVKIIYTCIFIIKISSNAVGNKLEWKTVYENKNISLKLWKNDYQYANEKL